MKGGITINKISLLDYLRENDVYVEQCTFKSYKKEDVYRQIGVACHIHKILMGYPSNGQTRLESIIGKRLEEYKVMYKFFLNNYKKALTNNKKRKIDEFIINNGSMLLNLAEKSLNSIDKRNYIFMIKRSMVRGEINLGRIDSSNLRVLDRIEIGTIKKLNYNLIEEDLVQYILKLRKRNHNEDESLIINKYINMEGLDFSSSDYIKALLSFPYQSLREINKSSNIYKNDQGEEDIRNLGNIMFAENYYINLYK